MRHPAGAIPTLVSCALSAAAAFVAVTAPDPTGPYGFAVALQVAGDGAGAGVSHLRLVIAALPFAALAAGQIAWRRPWR